MADTRSRAAKLRAIIDASSGASDGERANARVLLERLEGATAEPRTPRHRTFIRKRVRVDVDEFLKSYQQPGFSNGDRAAKRPIVDVHEPDPYLSRDDVKRIESNGATVGTLQFGDVLGPGERLEVTVTPLTEVEAGGPIPLGAGRRFDKEP